MAEEVVCLKSRHEGSAASTVSAFSGSAGNCASRTMQNTFVASRIEMKGWGCWRNISGTGMTLEQLISMAKARLKQDDLNVFDWDLTDRDQGNLDTKMMAFMWFKKGDTPMVRKRVQFDFQQYLTIQPLKSKDANVRATLEVDPLKRLWNTAQAIFVGVMREHANCLGTLLTSDGWIPDSVAAPRGSSVISTPLASFTIGTTWELNRERFQNFAPHVDVEAIQTFLSGA